MSDLKIIHRVASRFMAAKANPAELAEAKKLGEAAFKKGIKAPALDKEFGKLLKGKGFSAEATSLLKAWTEGWTKANLADTDWMKDLTDE